MELTPGPRLVDGHRLVRALAVMVCAAGLALSGARVVGTRFEPVLLAPAAVSVVVGWLLARLHIVVRAAGQALAFIASGLLVAYAADGTATDFGHGVLEGPRQVVTTAWPSPRFPTIFVALAALIFVASAVSIDLAMRVRWRAMAIVPLVVAMVAMVAVGAPDGAQWEAVVSTAAAAFVLLWIGLDDRVASVRSGVLVAVATGLAALIATAGIAIAAPGRANPRRGEAATRELELLDPLAEVAAQSGAEVSQSLYEVESTALDRLSLWRAAALDVYDGESWSTNATLTPIGNRLDPGTGAEQVVVTVTARRADTVLWISPGRLLRSTSPVETDSARHVVGILGADRPAVTTFTVEPLAAFDPATAGVMPAIQPTDVENSYSVLAMKMAGGNTGTVAEQVATIAAALHDDYELDSKAPGGVQQNLVDTFLRVRRKGNVEQFVTGFVLLARSLGVDARIATGYRLDTSLPAATITTAGAVAWPEVQVGSGWVTVDVLPDDAGIADPPPAPAGLGETPPAAQPPDPPQVDQAEPNEPVHAPPLPPRQSAWSAARVWAVRGGVAAGLVLWPLLVFAVVVTWMKLRRRTGLKASDPARRVSTAWTLATDALIDAGATLNTSDTNAELVAAGVRTQPAAGGPLGRLQRHADAVIFTSASCDPARAADAVDQLRLIESSIRHASSRWWRWKWWLSTRSLRRRTQSPLR